MDHNLSQASFMDVALEEARAAAERGEVPVGAVLTFKGEIVARDGNRTREWGDATAHAELIVIQKALRLKRSERLIDHDLYVTLEPCVMCAGAISHARIRRLYFAADDPKMGAVLHGPRVFEQATCHHRPDVYDGLAAADAARLLTDFFARKR